jgi:hypothetical protein
MRYVLDIRSGCGGIHDSEHEYYGDSNGLSNHLPDVIEYKPGYKNLESNSWDMKKEDIDYLTKLCDQMNSMTELELIRDIKISIIEGKYLCIDNTYKIPDNPIKWLPCPNCDLTPLVWEFNNGRLTACGCGENIYNHFSIHSESIMSHIQRNNGSALEFDQHGLKKNWNHWVLTGEELESHKELRKLERW